MEKAPANKRRSDETDAGRRKSLRKKRDSDMSDEFRLNDIDSQSMLSALHPYDSLDQNQTSFQWTPADVARHLAVGSRHPAPKKGPRPNSARSPPKSLKQARVDNCFSPTKSGAIDPQTRQSDAARSKDRPTVVSLDAALGNKPPTAPPTFAVPPPRDLRSVAHNVPKESTIPHRSVLNGSTTSCDKPSFTQIQPQSPKHCQKPVAASVTTPTKPSMFEDKSFSTSIESRATSFTSVFSTSGKGSAQTSFTEASDSSQGALRSFDGPSIEKSPAKALRPNGDNTTTSSSPIVSFRSEHYHVRDFPSKGLFGKIYGSSLARR